MARSDAIDTDVPGTVYLVDATGSLRDVAHAGTQDVLLIPQPTSFSADPLVELASLQEILDPLPDLHPEQYERWLRFMGFFNIIWIPTAMRFGRKIVYILSLLFVLGSGIWGGFYQGVSQYYIMMVVNGIGTAAYQALIQLTIFDVFFTHERGRMLSIYIFFQQLGSIIGLICGGYISDGIGWRWSMPIVSIACAVLILLFIFTFDDTMFPRYRFSGETPQRTTKAENETARTPSDTPTTEGKDSKVEPPMSIVESRTVGEMDMPPRTYLQKMSPVHYFKDDNTTWYQYFRRPFFLFAFPNILLAGIQFAFGCTAGIVSFNTISEIMTEAPYNWSAGSAGLIFLAALVGNFLGMGIGSLSDWVVVFLARRNKGYKEPEMRLWTYSIPLVLAAVGYFVYGWGATEGLHWMSIAVGLCCMIAQQVSATSIATAYAMECFEQISGELVIVLACCSSIINFVISFTVQDFIDGTNYGWTFTFYGIMVVLSMAAGAPMIIWGKDWRRKCKPRYEKFLAETGRQ
ncbi:major facilitator superfamily domain-containing protein [Aspergillus welwitschiae]|uniref:Major facilitator superfamily domain-containing protein n=1 Tax=Aspergillus welwitschiae TaxID=1341132 RepID=A0A3F3QJM3_9EURO|nr:major facilitator superfamily domain-containing protein [Aspergillus welwitschiae]RDH39381.1 major facilitator superfamily domain-containing protein [Aspergillus welwitschiae]